MKEIDINKAYDLENPIFIDVRSPVEFKEAHIPGAKNIPLFSDEEREQVGILYKQKGQEQAKWLALQIIAPKIQSLLNSIKAEADRGKKPIVYCWRGGMRSKSVVTFADLAGISIYRLTGGFKHYRQWVIDHLNPSLLPQRFVVLHGMTGVGKTTLLDMLSQKQFPILDLEKCAGHRGSVFGGIGKPVHTQKTFEALLVYELQKLKGLPYVFIEAESKRIGKVVQPDFLLEEKKKGIHIHLETSVEIRVNRIYEEYVESFSQDPHFKQRVLDAISPILKRFPTALKKDVQSFIEKEDYQSLIAVLLKEYYDPRYTHKLTEYEGDFYSINADDLEQVVNEIVAIVLNNQNMKLSSKS